jgi:glyoxylase-like metal-dependent hydrolase (beta-lactamase superfamily II)
VSTSHDREDVRARLDIVAVGYADDRVASTVVLVRDAEAIIVIDPGMAASRDVILEPLATLGVSPPAVTDVIFSHHHPDHTLNAALFPDARFHDHWAIYQDDVWIDRPAEGYTVSPSVQLLETPGHTAEDITTLVRTDDGLVACTHLWWSAEGPEEDPLATDQALLLRSRARILALGVDLIVPGHGPPFVPPRRA